MCGEAGEVQCSLPRRVRSADDEHLSADHALRLRCRPAVVDTGTIEVFERGDPQSPVADARREEHRARGDRTAVGEDHRELTAVVPEIRHPLHEGEVRPEDPRLLVSVLRQPTAAHTLREAEVVADQRARGGLPAEAAFVDDQGAEPLGRAVDRGGQTRGPGADDHQIEVPAARAHRRTGRQGEVRVRGVLQHRPVREDHERKCRDLAGFRDELASEIRVGEAKGMWQRAAPQCFTELVRPPRP